MPTFQTPEPITASVEVVSGSVHVAATERGDTVVAVNPRDPNRASDVRVAEAARIDFRNGTLTVSAGRRFISLGRGGAVSIEIELPSRSRLEVSSASADVHTSGAIGDFRFSTASGDANVHAVVGNIKMDSASGDLAVESLAGDAVIATASGDVAIGTVTGDVTFRAASGDLSVRRLDGVVNAETASGDVNVADAVNGALSMQTGSGEFEVGVPHGTAAQLDVRTHSGNVRNSLQPTDGPVTGDETLTVHVRSGSGDIVVQRAAVGVG